MNDHHPKRIAIVFVLALAVLVGAAYLLAKPTPSTSVPAPSPPAAQTTQTTTSTTSTKPKITWSTTSTTLTLPANDVAAKDFIFTSNQNLQGVVVEAVPQIAGLLSIQPSSFANVSAGSSTAVHISFLAPSSTTLGTYSGTIHLRVGSTTFPQTLKVTINVWNLVTDDAAGLSILFPPSLYNLTDANSPPDSFNLESSPHGVAIGGAVPSGSPVARNGFGIGIDSKPFSVSSSFDIAQYLASEFPNSVADAVVTSTSVCGKPGFQVFFTGEEDGSWPVVVSYQNGRVYRFMYASTDVISDQVGLNVFSSVITACSLQ